MPAPVAERAGENKAQMKTRLVRCIFQNAGQCTAVQAQESELVAQRALDLHARIFRIVLIEAVLVELKSVRDTLRTV